MGGSIYSLEFEQPAGKDLGAQLKEIIDFLSFIEDNPNEKEFIINLSKIKFVHPLFVLALASLTDYLKKDGYKIHVQKSIHSPCSAYLDRVYFPSGIKPDDIKNWGDLLNKYKGKNYLPIINFSTSRQREQTNIREKVISKLNSLVKENLNLDSNYESAVIYLISEITDNIIEHSGINRGWISLQYYPTTEYLDICIIDNGKTILGSYKDYEFDDIRNDDEALEAALKGISTKSIERGTGIRTSRAITSLGLNGDFAIFSGKSLYYRDQIAKLKVRWPGTFIALRIKKGIQNFSIYPYI